MPKLKAAAGNQAAVKLGRVTGNPRLVRFIWLRHDAYHAIVEFENGVWFVLLWAGIWSTAEVLRRKWDDRLRGSLDHRPQIQWGVDDEIPSEARPSGWVIVGQDHWAAQVAYQEIAPDEGPYTKLVFVDGEELTGEFLPLPSDDRIVERNPSREVGEPARVLRKLEENEGEAAINGAFPFGVFRTITEYHGATAAQVARLLGNADDEGPVLRRLVASGLVATIDGRYYLTEPGWRRAAKIDRVHGGRAKTRLASFITEEDHTRKRYRRHDAAVMDLADQFRRHGIPVANGWRAVLNVKNFTQVAPDLVVCVGDGPFGNSWCYLEFERSATGLAAVERKLRPYVRMADMGASIPLLVVCEQRTAEEVFWAKGRGLRMLTITLAEARSGPPGGTHHGLAAFRSAGLPVCPHWRKAEADRPVGTAMNPEPRTFHGNNIVTGGHFDFGQSFGFLATNQLEEAPTIEDLELCSAVGGRVASKGCLYHIPQRNACGDVTA